LKQWICDLKQLVTNSPRVSLYALWLNAVTFHKAHMMLRHPRRCNDSSLWLNWRAYASVTR